MCIEPTETSEQFIDARSCNLVRTCVWSENTKLHILERGGVSTLLLSNESITEALRKKKTRDHVVTCDAVDGETLLRENFVRNTS